MNNAQLHAWAIDRAIETFRGDGKRPTAEQVIEVARAYVEYTQEGAKKDAAEQSGEAIQ